MSTLDLSHRAPGELKPRRRTFRTHSPDQVARLARSIEQYGFNQPVAIDGDDRIVCGAALVEAAKRLRLNQIPVVQLKHLSEGELRAYSVAANKLADLAGYDEVELSLELADIRALVEIGELPELGIETSELDRLLDLSLTNANEDDATLAMPGGPVVVQPGDLWEMGPHRVFCGSALEASSFDSLMAGALAQFTMSDVPYNLTTRTFSTTGRHADFVQGAGEMSATEFTRFLTTAMRHMARWSSDGSIAMFFMSHHFLLELLRAGRIVYGDLKTLITWVKPHPGLGSWYRSQSEFIAAFKNGKGPQVTNVGPGGRTRSTVWEYDSLAQFGADRDEQLAMHPSCKPVSLIADAIRDNSHRGGLVLDPFAGSGTLAIAAEQTGRIARMVELDPRYVDAGIRRFRKVTGIEPVLARTGDTLTAVEEQERGR